MKSVEYQQLQQLITNNSDISYFPLDNLLSKMDTQNLLDLKEILNDFSKAGQESDGTYNEGYNDGRSAGYERGYDDGYEAGKEDYME